MNTRRATLKWEGLLAERVRSRRLKRGWRQEDLAHRMREMGFDWSQPTVAAVESGRRDCSVPECAALTSAFLRQRSEKKGLADFLSLDDDETGYLVLGADGEAFAPADIRIELAPGHVHLELSALVDALRGGDWGPWSAGAALSGGPGLLDWNPEDPMVTKLARTLGVSAEDVRTASQRLWSRDPQDERDSRLGDVANVAPRTVQARRGHITRTMTAELRSELG